MKESANIIYRATSLDELAVIVSKSVTEEGWLKGQSFQPCSNDIVITPYAKCGTTWLQQIVHGLRTRGSMDFDEISRVIPWIELAHDLGCDLNAPQVAKPGVYKSHSSWYEIPKGGRYICAFRNADEAIVSFYRFYDGWLLEPDTVSLEAFTNWRWPRDKVDTKGYWHHLISWWKQRHNENVLLLCYEDMKTDLPDAVRKIAKFIDISLDDELLEIVVRQSSREFMLAHKDKFDEKYFRQLIEKRTDIPPGGDSSKLTLGASDKACYQLPQSLKQEFDDIWQEQIQPESGLKNYEEFRQAVKVLNRRR